MFLGLEDSHDASKSTPWARKIKRQDDRLKFTVARARAHFRFVISVLFAIFGSVFVQFCVSGLASCLRFVSVLLPFRCCIVSVARKRCVNFFFGCYCTWFNEKEGRKKEARKEERREQARSNKQQGKATQHTQGSQFVHVDSFANSTFLEVTLSLCTCTCRFLITHFQPLFACECKVKGQIIKRNVYGRGESLGMKIIILYTIHETYYTIPTCTVRSDTRYCAFAFRPRPCLIPSMLTRVARRIAVKRGLNAVKCVPNERFCRCTCTCECIFLHILLTRLSLARISRVHMQTLALYTLYYTTHGQACYIYIRHNSVTPPLGPSSIIAQLERLTKCALILNYKSNYLTPPRAPPL